MELYHLRTFVIVAEEQNLTRAAKRLYMTPPSVSAQIKALEAELNLQLFARTPKGMVLTEKGLILKQKADHTLQAAQDLVNHATQLQAHLIGHLNVGLNASASFLRVPHLITTMQQQCPGIELTFLTSVSGHIIERLQTGRLDVGYIFGSSPSADIKFEPLDTVNLVIAAPKIWQAKLEQADWQMIADLPWIHTPGYCPFQTITERLFQQHGVMLNQWVKVGDEATKVALVSAGVGLALLEEHEAQLAEAVIIWETEPIPCDISLAYLNKRQTDPLIRAIRQIIQTIWRV